MYLRACVDVSDRLISIALCPFVCVSVVYYVLCMFVGVCIFFRVCVCGHICVHVCKCTCMCAGGRRLRNTEKSDHATTELVLDPRTRLILYKLLNRDFLQEVNGCVSTGKEANVYHAIDGQGGELAVKIFKTSILVFKDRERYVQGEHRFRRGFNKSNPRKMVRMWAEKETRNLKRC